MSKSNTRGSAYIQVIGPERDNDDKALSSTVQRIGKSYEVIKNPADIKFDTTIYLVAHGNDPTVTSDIKLGDKSPKQAVDIVADIFKEAKGLDVFKGKIILEGCHTAEPIPDPKPDYDTHGAWTTKVMSSKCKIEGSSFLAEFKNIFKEEFRLNKSSFKVAPEVEIGGYLGAAFEGDYSKTGYGTSYSTNPLTIRFQQSRCEKGDSSMEISKNGGVLYDEESSYLQTRFGQELPFGDKNVKNKNGSR